jgi:hypothetical protein
MVSLMECGGFEIGDVCGTVRDDGSNALGMWYVVMKTAVMCSGK